MIWRVLRSGVAVVAVLAARTASHYDVLKIIRKILILVNLYLDPRIYKCR